MKAEDTPLYVRSYDLARYLFERTGRFPKNQRFVLAQRIEAAAFDLLEAVTLALVQRDARDQRLVSADSALTRLRLAVRMSHDVAGAQFPRLFGVVPSALSSS